MGMYPAASGNKEVLHPAACATGVTCSDARPQQPPLPTPLRTSGYHIGLDYCWLVSWCRRYQKIYFCRMLGVHFSFHSMCVYPKCSEFCGEFKVMAKLWLGLFSGHNVHALDDLSHRDGRSKQCLSRLNGSWIEGWWITAQCAQLFLCLWSLFFSLFPHSSL